MAEEPKYFRSAAAFRRWLAKNAATESALDVGFWKKHTTEPTLTWPESVDEALCYGWIDGVRRKVDDDRYRIRFSPRRPRSIWSAINLRRFAELVAEGRVTPQGHAAHERRLEARSKVYAYEQRDQPELSPEELKQFKKDKPAWAFYQALPPGYRKTITWWVVSAKLPATRTRRFDTLRKACAAGKRL